MQKEIEQKRDETNTLKKIEKMKDEELFEVTDKSKGIKKQKYALDPQRFKRKMWKFLGKSEMEAKVVEKLAKKIQKLKKEEKKEKKGKKEGEVFDLWETKGKNDELKHKVKPFRPYLPAVIPPHAGQSYNPSADDYKVFILINTILGSIK